MPEKDGDEGKSTKSVVNKKQKQMMGEEGYDIARDMGRVRPSKDKKDATTMPPSKEMKKTQKVNKGPSALDIVKKKYKGQIMKMEELDLTKVAESFGGYIIEVKTKKQKLKQLTLKIADKSAAAAGRADSRNPKMGGGASTFDLEPEPGDKRVLPDDPGQAGKAGKVRIVQKGVKKPKVTVVQTGVKSPKPEKPEDIKGTAKQFVKDLGTTGEKQTPQTKKELENIKQSKPKRGSVTMGSQRNVFTGKPELEKVKTTYNTRTKTKKPKMDKGPVIPGMEPYGFTKKPRTIPFKDKPELDTETQKKVDAVTPPFATKQGETGPLPVSMRNRRVTKTRSLSPNVKVTSIVKPTVGALTQTDTATNNIVRTGRKSYRDFVIDPEIVQQVKPKQTKVIAPEKEGETIDVTPERETQTQTGRRTKTKTDIKALKPPKIHGYLAPPEQKIKGTPPEPIADPIGGGTGGGKKTKVGTATPGKGPFSRVRAFARRNPVVSLIGYDALKNVKVPSVTKPTKTGRVSAGS